MDTETIQEIAKENAEYNYNLSNNDKFEFLTENKQQEIISEYVENLK
jgi:hypothetical protein